MNRRAIETSESLRLLRGAQALTREYPMKKALLRRRFAPLALSVLGLAGLVSLGHAQSFERKEFPQWADPAFRVGSAPDSERVSIAAYLGFRNEETLKQFVAEVSTPGGVHYGKYLTPDQF